MLFIVPRGTRNDEINACLKRSFLWLSVMILKLTKYIRVHLGGVYSSSQFSDLLLKLGNGGYLENYGIMSIPHERCTIVTKIEELIEKMYSDVVHIYDKPMEWFCERVIQIPKND